VLCWVVLGLRAEAVSPPRCIVSCRASVLVPYRMPGGKEERKCRSLATACSHTHETKRNVAARSLARSPKGAWLQQCYAVERIDCADAVA